MSRGQEDLVEARLRELREAMRGVSAPAPVRAAALEEFRARRAPVKRPWALVWAAALALVVALGVGLTLVMPVLRAPVESPSPLLAKMPAPAVPKAVVDRRPAEAPRMRRPALAASRRTVPKMEADQAVPFGGFLALPYAPPLSAAEGAQVIRVGLPASALRQFGVPVNVERLSERFPADVVFGEDGVARAVRFVKTSR